MEIAGKVATTDVLITAVRDLTIGVHVRKAVQDLREKTVVRDLTTEAHVRKAVQDLREKTAVRDLTTEAQGRKAVRDQQEKTEAQGQSIVAQDRLMAQSRMLTPHRIQILAIRQNQNNNKRRGAPLAPLSFLKYKWRLVASATK